jgi:hypothetical protein
MKAIFGDIIIYYIYIYLYTVPVTFAGTFRPQE